jgi:hypothetical protein
VLLRHQRRRRRVTPAKQPVETYRVLVGTHPLYVEGAGSRRRCEDSARRSPPIGEHGLLARLAFAHAHVAGGLGTTSLMNAVLASRTL